MQSDAQRHTGITSYRLGDLYPYSRDLFTAESSSGRIDLRAVFSELLSLLSRNLQFEHLGFGLHDPSRNTISVLFESGEFRLPQEVPVIDTSLGLVLHDQ